MGSVHVDLNMDPVKDIEHTEGSVDLTCIHSSTESQTSAWVREKSRHLHLSSAGLVHNS